ncbi:MAG: hypothetical protein ACYCWW_18515, partial [Deltaproteobacteria bacterium]
MRTRDTRNWSRGATTRSRRGTSPRPTVLLLALSACCRGPSVQQVSPAVRLQSSAGQAISTLVFPVTPFGQKASQSFAVASISTIDAHVTKGSFGGPQAALFSLSPGAPVTVPQSSVATFSVTFAPVLPTPIPSGDVQDQAVLTLTTDDPAHPTLSLNLSAKAAAPAVDLCWAETPTTQSCLSQGPVTVPFGSIAPGGSSAPQE